MRKKHSFAVRKRTFTHLLLRPGYMIRDYIKGEHERYLAPLTALIVFYAFFALVSAVLQPVQQKKNLPIQDSVSVELDESMAWPVVSLISDWGEAMLKGRNSYIMKRVATDLACSAMNMQATGLPR